MFLLNLLKEDQSTAEIAIQSIGIGIGDIDRLKERARKTNISARDKFRLLLKIANI